MSTYINELRGKFESFYSREFVFSGLSPQGKYFAIKSFIDFYRIYENERKKYQKLFTFGNMFIEKERLDHNVEDFVERFEQNEQFIIGNLRLVGDDTNFNVFDTSTIMEDIRKNIKVILTNIDLIKQEILKQMKESDCEIIDEERLVGYSFENNKDTINAITIRTVWVQIDNDNVSIHRGSNSYVVLNISSSIAILPEFVQEHIENKYPEYFMN